MDTDQENVDYRGWFHRDTILGSVKVPLVGLETKCTLHDSFDVSMEGRVVVMAALVFGLSSGNGAVLVVE